MRKIVATLAVMLFSMAAFAQYTNELIAVGQKAPELAYKNPEEKLLKLSEINKGRYVLLDFWASWCRPCRAANPGVVAMYNRYKDKQFAGAKNGFTIVSVSLDQTAEAWKQAIATDKLAWPYHMSDLLSWNSAAAAAYGIQFVPQCFLLGPDGKVIGKYMHAEEAEAELAKRLK